jgi:hypothetical protein
VTKPQTTPAALSPADKRAALEAAGFKFVKLTAYERHALARVAANDNARREVRRAV